MPEALQSIKEQAETLRGLNREIERLETMLSDLRQRRRPLVANIRRFMDNFANELGFSLSDY